MRAADKFQRADSFTESDVRISQLLQTMTQLQRAAPPHKLLLLSTYILETVKNVISRNDKNKDSKIVSANRDLMLSKVLVSSLVLEISIKVLT
jgi:hypothetical protein